MELRDYLRVYRQGWIIIVSMVVVATAAVLIYAAVQPVRSGVSVSFAINRINKETTPDYQFDGYYALQASDLFAQTVVSWFSTPSVLREVYDQAGYDPQITSPNSLVGRFKVKKYSSQNIVVRFTESNDQRAQKMADALKTIMEKHTADLNQNSAGKAIFAMVGNVPVIAPVKPSLALDGAVAAVLSLLAGMFVVTARHYLKS